MAQCTVLRYTTLFCAVYNNVQKSHNGWLNWVIFYDQVPALFMYMALNAILC